MSTTFGFAIDAFTGESKTLLACDLTGGLAEKALIGHLQSIPQWNFDDWECLRKAFVGAKPENMSQNAADKRWAALVKDAGMEKPKSGKVDAQVKQTQRAKQSEKMEALLAMDLPELEKLKNTAVKDSDFTQAGLVQRALDKKATELLKPQEDAFKKELKTVREALNKLKVTDKATLDKIAKILKV